MVSMSVLYVGEILSSSRDMSKEQQRKIVKNHETGVDW